MRKLAAVLALIAPLFTVTLAAPLFADRNGDAPATYIRLDQETTYRLYRQAAEQGNADAQILLGNMHASGQGVPRDYAEAAKWYRRAAEQGNADAQYNLGMMYANGQGVPRDSSEAAKWCRNAADQGHGDAQYDLGVMYDEGQGVPRNDILAYMFFELAATNIESASSRETARENRNLVASRMTPARIAEAQRLAREWKPKQKK